MMSDEKFLDKEKGYSITEMRALHTCTRMKATYKSN